MAAAFLPQRLRILKRRWALCKQIARSSKNGANTPEQISPKAIGRTGLNILSNFSCRFCSTVLAIPIKLCRFYAAAGTAHPRRETTGSGAGNQQSYFRVKTRNFGRWSQYSNYFKCRSGAHGTQIWRSVQSGRNESSRNPHSGRNHVPDYQWIWLPEEFHNLMEKDLLKQECRCLLGNFHIDAVDEEKFSKTVGYQQNLQPDTQSIVTFGSMVFTGNWHHNKFASSLRCF